MSHYEREIDTLRASLAMCPTGFLSSLKFEIEVILMERDENYQAWLLRQHKPRLTIVKNTDETDS